jgi:hypothetical protein
LHIVAGAVQFNASPVSKHKNPAQVVCMLKYRLATTPWPFSDQPLEFVARGYIYSFYAYLCFVTLPGETLGWRGKVQDASL